MNRAVPVLLTETISRQEITRVVFASGVLQPALMVDVGAQVSGQLKRLHVKLGQTVQRGQLLAELDPKLALSELLMTQADLVQVGAEERALLVRQRQAIRESGRQHQLQEGGVSSLREREQAETERVRLDAELAGVRARIQRARYVVEQARTRLAYTRIVAPMTGQVLSIDTQEGQTVIAAQQAPTILKLGELSRIKVRAHVSEADIVQVQAGQRAWFSLLGNPEIRYEGRVEEILPSPQKRNDAVFYSVQFFVPNPKLLLRTDMTAQVTIVLDEVRKALAVPLMALHGGEGTWHTVQILTPRGKVIDRRVRIGLRGQTHAQVLDGLALGDKVVLASQVGEEETHG